MWHARIALLIAHLLAFLLPRNVPIVDVGYGQYQGTYDPRSDVTSYWGIRFAQPPTGNLRWDTPKAPEYIPGVQKAVFPPNACPQAPSGKASTRPFPKREINGPEDCLFLNVFIPGQTISKGLPVLVYIHGGGYGAGSSAPHYGADLVRQSGHGIVAVTIQYRLGIFGFLPGQAVKDGGVLNAGLLDQDFALQWIQEHIASFGGDPSKVTIWGLSAGGGSVLLHVVANDGNTQPPRFRAAMTSSACIQDAYLYNDPMNERKYLEAVKAAGCSSANDTLQCLRDSDYETLEFANAVVSIQAMLSTPTFVPVVDGEFIVQSPSAAMAQGLVNGEAMLIMTNTDEGAIFVPDYFDELYDTGTFAREEFPELPDTSGVSSLYASAGSNLDQLKAVFGESTFVCPSYRLLKAFNGRAYKGQFAIPPGVHAQDIDYYFPTGRSRSFDNQQFTDAFAQSFVSFAISLDPNVKVDPAGILPEWPLYSEGNVQMVFNQSGDSPDVRVWASKMDLLERCSFWDSVSKFTGQ